MNKKITRFEEHKKRETVKNIKNLVLNYIYNQETGTIKKEGLSYIINGMYSCKNEQTLFSFGLKGFKKFNDTQGHDVGDELLDAFKEEIAKNLKRNPNELIIDLKHDTVIVVTDKKNEQEIEQIKEQISNASGSLQSFGDVDMSKYDVSIKASYINYNPKYDDAKKKIDQVEDLIKDINPKVNIYKHTYNNKDYILKLPVNEAGEIDIQCIEDIYIGDLSKFESAKSIGIDKRSHSGYNQYFRGLLEKGNLIKACIENDEEFFNNKDLNKLLSYRDELYSEIFIDPNTGFFKKNYKEQKLNYAETENPILISLDVNGLGTLNSLNGSEAGDRLIKKVSELFRNAFPDTKDMIIRAGGDEFFIKTDSKDALKKLMEFYVSLADHNANPDREFDINVSFGYSSHDTFIDPITDERLDPAETERIIENNLINNKTETKKQDPEGYLLVDCNEGKNVVEILTGNRNKQTLYTPVEIDKLPELPEDLVEGAEIAIRLKGLNEQNNTLKINSTTVEVSDSSIETSEFEL